MATEEIRSMGDQTHPTAKRPLSETDSESPTKSSPLKSPRKSISSSVSASFVRGLNISLDKREMIIKSVLNCKFVDELSDSDSSTMDSALPLPANEVKDQWELYLRKNVPEYDWLAMWEQSQGIMTCVDVVEVNFDKLNALVVVLENQSDDAVEEGEVFAQRANLLDLYPILDEDSNRDLEEYHIAAEALDHSRFFFKNLWTPWDKDSGSDDWPGDHLTNRFELFKESVQLGDEARNWLAFQRLCRKYLQLNAELESIKVNNDEDKTRNVARVLQIEDEQYAIRRKAMILEDIELRMAVSVTELEDKRQVRDAQEPMIHIVTDATVSELATILEQLQTKDESLSSLKVKLHETIDHGIMACIKGDILVVPPGTHQDVGDLGELQDGGSVLFWKNTPDDEAKLVTNLKLPSSDKLVIDDGITLVSDS